MSPKKRLVSDDWIKLLSATADDMMNRTPSLREKWLDQNRTSHAAREAGGLLHYETDYDWALAFFVWLRSSEQTKSKMPRLP